MVDGCRAGVIAAHPATHDRTDRPVRRDRAVRPRDAAQPPKEPPLPAGYDGERQLAELRALTVAIHTTESTPLSPHH